MSRVYQTYLDVLDIIEDMYFEEAIKEEEKQKATESREICFGPNYVYFPPWSKN